MTELDRASMSDLAHRQWERMTEENKQLHARIAELEAEIERLKDQLRQFEERTKVAAWIDNNATIERCAQVVEMRMKYPQEDAIEWVRQIAQEIRDLKSESKP